MCFDPSDSAQARGAREIDNPSAQWQSTPIQADPLLDDPEERKRARQNQSS
jgi:hypothetical protein